MKNYDVIILGGGASGCICSIIAGKRGKRVLVIDRDNRPAKKILATGNGRCNLTNLNMSSKFFNQNIDIFLHRFSSPESIKFFKDMGLITYSDDEGRVYPLSNSARSVMDVINLSMKENNVDFLGEEEILSIDKGDKFVVKTSKSEFFCEKIVFSLGGRGISLAQTLERITPPRPSLTGIKTKSTRSLAGCRVSCMATLTLENGQKFKEEGEVLFKDSGLSGICIFNLSSILARTILGGKISLDLMPQKSEGEVFSLLAERKSLPRKVSQIFDGIFLPQVGYEILNRLHLDEEKQISNLSQNEITSLAKTIKNLEFQITGIYDNNQVFSGGVPLSALTKNLESKKHAGLYFTGEACDVDGICGGYNLQWAWTSGIIVGESV